MTNKEGSTKIVDFMTSRVWVVVLGCGRIGVMGKMLNFVKIIYSTP